MSSITKNYGLLLPAQDDFYDVDDFNGNAVLIDTEIKNRALEIEQLNTDVNDLSADVGDPAGLETQAKTSVVAALNEVLSKSAKDAVFESDGYINIGGLLVQWGRHTATKDKSVAEIPFKLPFGEVYNVQFSLSRVTDEVGLELAGKTFIYFDTKQLALNSSEDVDIYWLVIGKAGD